MKFGLTKYTLDSFFHEVVRRYGAQPALALVGEKPYTYNELKQRVLKCQYILYKLGVKKGDKVAILGPSSPNWGVAFLAIMTMGAIAVPIMDQFPEADINHIIKHSKANGLFICEKIYQKIELVALTERQFKISLNSMEIISPDENQKTILKQLSQAAGKLISLFDKKSFDPDNVDIAEDDIAEILYTSGTTGHSKGVMLSHKNLVSNLFEGPDILKVFNSNSVILNILPMAHVFGSTSAFLAIIYCGASIYFLNKKPSPKILLTAMQMVKPTIIGAVPLVFEKIYQNKVLPALASSSFLRFLTKFSLGRNFVYKKIGKKILQSFGGRLQCAIIGGASLDNAVEYFLQKAEIPYVLGYGLSECSPLVAISSMEDRKLGSVGPAITDVTIKISDPEPETGIGEILVKGPNIMKGYYLDDEATTKTFTDDGWFITGDRGYLDSDNYLFIKGRSKNVIIGPSGENIYPEIIESVFKRSLFVDEIIVYMDKEQLVARIYPDYNHIQSLEKDADEKRLSQSIEQILEKLRVEINRELPVASKVKRVIEQTEPFIKTPTQKIKRGEYITGY